MIQTATPSQVATRQALRMQTTLGFFQRLLVVISVPKKKLYFKNNSVKTRGLLESPLLIEVHEPVTQTTWQTLKAECSRSAEMLVPLGFPGLVALSHRKSN